LIGGKWTTFRAFSEQAADQVLDELGVDRVICTEDLMVGGAKELEGLQDKLKGFDPISDERMKSLEDKYGSLAIEILEQGDEVMLKSYPEMSKGEIKYLIQNEDVVHLDDLIFRRSTIGKLGELTDAGLKELAELTADVLGWDESQKQDEISRVKKIMEDKHRMRFNEFIEINNATNS
jgi:glycerol-3-phosphate dehydrogenase